MTNTALIAKHLDRVQGKEKGTCKMCGLHTDTGHKAKAYIKDARFTNFDLLKNVESDIICADCAACLSEDKIRRSCFIADDEKIVFLKKNELEEYLFDMSKIKIPFVFCVTQSFKKHLSYKATVNYDTKKFVITHENYSFTFDVSESKAVYDKLNAMYVFFSKDELLSGNYNIQSLRSYYAEKGNMREFEKNEETFKKYRGSYLFDFLVFILNSEKKQAEVKKCRKK